MATQNGNNVNGNGAVHFDDMASLSAALTGGIVNPQTGQGMYGDDPSRSAVAAYGGRLDRESLNITFEKYGLLRKVVCNIPRAATYRWGEPTIAKGSNSKLDELVTAINQLPIETSLHTYTGAKKGFLEAMKAAFLTGNAGLVMQVDDGLQLDQELDLKRVRSVKGLWLMNRWQLVPDLQSFTLFKKTTHFRVQDGQRLGDGYQGQNRIHRSRVLWFRGSEAVDDYESNRHQGCDASILEPLMESFNLFLAGVKGAGRMIADFDFYVHAIDGLLAKLEANPTKAQAAIAARMAINRQRRSINRDMVIDKEHETITNVSRTVAGYSDLLQHCKDFLLASADYPAELLYGEFPTGLNAPSTESGSRQTWNDTIAQTQEDKLHSQIMRLNQVLCAAKDGPTQGQEIKGLGWKWHVLYESSPSENATLQNTFATMVSTLNEIDPRIALAMIVSGWGGERFSQEINLTPELVKALEEKIKQDPAQQQDPDVSALAGDDQPSADAPSDGTEPSSEVDQEQQDQSIADDILSDRTLLDSADSPHLDDATPTKRIIDWRGFKIGLQYQPFDIRHGKVLPVAYGHLQKTRGADGMACDCYVGANLESDRVFEITQLVNGQFDEHKYMLGFDSLDDARNTFLKVMPADMFGGIQEVGLAGLATYKTDSADSSIDVAYAKYHGTVNMSASELLAWSKTRWSKLAGVDRSPVQRNLKLLQKTKDQWTTADATQALRTVSFIARMRGAGKGEPVSADAPQWMTKRLISLRNWSYDDRKTVKRDSDDVRLDATRKELLAKAKAKNEGMAKGKKFNTFGKTNAEIAEFVGEGIAQPTTAKTTAKPKGGTQNGKYQTSKTSSAIATAIAKKTGADPEAIEKDLRGKIQKAIDKTRREAKKAGKEPTEKELRAAARAVVKVEGKKAIASARGEDKPATAARAKAEKVPAQKSEKKARSVQPKASEVTTEEPIKESSANSNPSEKKEPYKEHPIFSTYIDKPELQEGESLSQRRQRWQSAKDEAINSLTKKGESQKLDASIPDTAEGWKNLKTSNQDQEQFMAAIAASNPARQNWLTTQLNEAKALAKGETTPEDVLAVKLYTTNDFGSMNGALRGLTGEAYRKTLNPTQAEGRSLDRIREEALQGAKVVTAALNKLPDHKGEVYRGFDLRGTSLDDIEKQYKAGSTVTEKAFTSTSTKKPDPNTAFGAKPVQFVIKSKTGKSLRDLSESQTEEEVLFRPSTAFKVSKVERKGDRITIHMEESDTPQVSKPAASKTKETQPERSTKLAETATPIAEKPAKALGQKKAKAVEEKPIAEPKAKKESKAKAATEKLKKAKSEIDLSDFLDDEKEPQIEFGKGKRTGKITKEKELEKSRQTLEKSFGKELVDKAEKNMQRLVDNADVYIRAPETVISSIIKDGGFKTAFDRNLDEGYNRDYVGRRIQAEQMLFGKDYDPPNVHRPIYGYLGDKEFDASSNVQQGPSQYGNVAVKLKPSAKKRATITDQDSWVSSLPSDAEKVNAATFTGAGMQKDGSGFIYNGESTAKKGLENAASAKSIGDFLGKHGSGYLETHIHDGVKPFDIAEMIYTNGSKPPKDVQDWAKKNGVTLTLKD